MDWYEIIAKVAILAQLFFVYLAVRNWRYALVKFGRRRPMVHHPRTALIIPCKGVDAYFSSNLRSFLQQDYPNYHLLVVVESESDPAYQEIHALLQEAKNEVRGSRVEGPGEESPRSPSSGPSSCRVLVAGPSESSSQKIHSQKIHNLLYALDHVPDDCEVLAFADSDVCVHGDWLRHLVRPLHRAGRRITTGHRWFVPARNNLATLALSALNAAVAQFLGNSLLNQAWGGSMAIRMEDLRRLGIREVWSGAVSDDLSLSRAVRQAGMTITFVPECLVASFESATWRKLCEFGRRQFLITRVYAPIHWWLGFLSSLGSVLGLWGGAAAALYAAAVHAEPIVLYAAVPLLFFAGQLLRAVLRQLVAARILRDQLPRLRPAAAADVLGGWLWSLLLLALMLSSAVGRTIRWRGIRYRLASRTETWILAETSKP